MKEVVNEEEKGGWTHGEWEVGKRLVAEEESGEEVAVREVRTFVHVAFFLLLLSLLILIFIF